jgi:hypothetical protein
MHEVIGAAPDTVSSSQGGANLLPCSGATAMCTAAWRRAHARPCHPAPARPWTHRLKRYVAALRSTAGTASAPSVCRCRSRSASLNPFLDPPPHHVKCPMRICVAAGAGSTAAEHASMRVAQAAAGRLARCQGLQPSGESGVGKTGVCRGAGDCALLTRSSGCAANGPAAAWPSLLPTEVRCVYDTHKVLHAFGGFEPEKTHYLWALADHAWRRGKRRASSFPCHGCEPARRGQWLCSGFRPPSRDNDNTSRAASRRGRGSLLQPAQPQRAAPRRLESRSRRSRRVLP